VFIFIINFVKHFYDKLLITMCENWVRSSWSILDNTCLKCIQRFCFSLRYLKCPSNCVFWTFLIIYSVLKFGWDLHMATTKKCCRFCNWKPRTSYLKTSLIALWCYFGYWCCVSNSLTRLPPLLFKMHGLFIFMKRFFVGIRTSAIFRC